MVWFLTFSLDACSIYDECASCHCEFFFFFFFFHFSFLILSRHWMLVASCVCIQCMEFGVLNYLKVHEHESVCMSPRYSFSCCLSVLSSHSHGKFNVNGRSKCRICFHPKAFTSYYTDYRNCQTPYNLMNRSNRKLLVHKNN